MPHSAVVDGRVRRSRLTSAYLLRLGSRDARRDVGALPRRPRRPAAPSPAPAPQITRARSAAPRCMGVTAGHVGSRVRRRGDRRASRSSASTRVVFEGAPGDADDVSVAAAARDEEVRRRARAAHRGQRPGRCSSPPTAPSPRPPPVPLTHRPDAGRARSRRPAASGSTSRCRATASSTAARGTAQRLLRRRATPSRSTVAVELVRALRRRRDRALGARARSQPERAADASAGTAPPAARSSATAATRSASTPPPSGATAASAQATAPGTPAEAVPGSFLFQRHIFPIRGPHDFGTGAAAFGGGRGHQGQDVFAACGTPLVAARGGIVKFKQLPVARAGNYLVIDGDGTGYDYAYMHLRERGARRTRATTSTPASRSATSATPATPTAATCTSRSGRRPGGTAAGIAARPAADR